jgi:tetratricopeptide (TPR) repeat protein
MRNLEVAPFHGGKMSFIRTVFGYLIGQAGLDGRSMNANRWRRFAGAATLSATVSALALMTAPALAQMLKDWKCTGDPDIPWNEQIVGCSNAINSGTIAGKDLPAAFSNRGRAYAARSDLDRALADYGQAIQLDSNAAYAFNGRGSVYFLKKDYDYAVADYARAISLNPNYAGAFNNRGNAYAAMGDTGRAIADYDRAIQLDPNDAVGRDC